jgi:cobalt/nickel transport protein
MIRNWTLELITAIAILAFISIFLIVSAGGNHEFSGSDDVGSQKIADLTGVSMDSIHPLIPQYIPPSGEIESSLFALQASFGGLILGLVFGYWLGQTRRNTVE